MNKKKLGGILFLAGSIIGIIFGFVAKSNTLAIAICQLVALIGLIMTGSSGLWIYIVGMVLTYVGAKGFLPIGGTGNTVIRYLGEIVSLVAIFFCWKDSIKDALK